MLWSVSMRRWWPGKPQGLSSIATSPWAAAPSRPCHGAPPPSSAQHPPRYYGCGLVIPECLSSCRILDLGSGSGRDCYLLSQLVGEQGHVTGIDMTEGQVWHRSGAPPHPPSSAPTSFPSSCQVEVAKKHIAYHTDKFGYRKPNVEFFHGYMEKLGDAGLADESYDIVM